MDIVSDLEYEYIERIRYAQLQKSDEDTRINILIIVLKSVDTEIDLEFINAISDECYSLHDNFTSEIRFYHPEKCNHFNADCILKVKRIYKDGHTRPHVVAATDKPAPAVS